jgi:hypothetical protein
LAMTNLPGPEQPEALPVPGNDGFRLDDDQGGSPIAPSFTEPRAHPARPTAKTSCPS